MVPAHQNAPNTLSAEEERLGFKLLFDGTTTNGWKGFRRDAMPRGWQAREGSLVYLPQVRAGGDICTVDEFSDFDFRIDWKVTPGGNSGIFFRSGEDMSPPWATGPEMQVLDNERHPDGRSPYTSAGANYGMHPVPRSAARPAGEWNKARIVAKGRFIEYWLNEQRVVFYEIGSPDWMERFKRGKFTGFPQHARRPSGKIVLQDHGNEVEFRNIKIRKL